MNSIYILFASLIALSTICALPMSIYEQKKYVKQIEAQGLYVASDLVTILTRDTFRDRVFGREYGSIVEFYNAYCGFCKRFAPTWKAFAADVNAWHDIVQVAAIDCAADENHDLCREFEVMGYPSIRYFSPRFKDEPNSFGMLVDGHDVTSLTNALGNIIRNETNPSVHWPQMHTIKDLNKQHLFDGLPQKVEYCFLIYSPDDYNMVTQIILDLHQIKSIVIRHIVSIDIAQGYGLSSERSLGAVGRNLEVVPLSTIEMNRSHIRNAIKEFSNRHLVISESSIISSTDSKSKEAVSIVGVDDKRQIDEIIKRVKGMNAHVMFQADLEQALRYSLFHEIPQFGEISGERFLALQRFISTLHRYSPLGSNGRNFLEELQIFIMGEISIAGTVFETKVKNLEIKWSPIFSSSRYVGCQSSVPGLRGFTCGLWTLFHYLTVQAADLETSHDPLEILQTILGYVKYFFGCSECSQHFQTMATQDRIWSVPSKDDAILWLWSAHNKVNERIKGDQTEDTKFPKIQFPSASHCTDCRRIPVIPSSSNHSTDLDGLEWDKTEVLLYLKRIYAAQNVSRIGVDNESMLPKTIEALRGKRLLENVFSDMDMRMGILLYLFCIAMMIVAVKLFVRRGYRKKMYSHDFMGKV